MSLSKAQITQLVLHAAHETGVTEGDGFVRAVVDLMYEAQSGVKRRKRYVFKNATACLSSNRALRRPLHR